MATNLEIRTTQKGVLFDLLKGKKEGDFQKAMEELILKMEAVMVEEDVALVKDKISMLD